MTQRLRAYAAGWRSMVGPFDLQAADLIRQDGIDILVDLTMHTANNRLLIFARKPAPVQVTYLAYCSSTGLEAIDYRLSDPYLDPPGMDESVYSERTVRPAGNVLVLSTGGGTGGQRVAGPGAGSYHVWVPEQFLQGERTDVGGMGQAVAGCAQCAVVAPCARRHPPPIVAGVVAGEGIEARRVGFAGYLPTEEYFASYGRIDVGLDTFPTGRDDHVRCPLDGGAGGEFGGQHGGGPGRIEHSVECGFGGTRGTFGRGVCADCR